MSTQIKARIYTLTNKVNENPCSVCVCVCMFAHTYTHTILEMTYGKPHHSNFLLSWRQFFKDECRTPWMRYPEGTRCVPVLLELFC